MTPTLVAIAGYLALQFGIGVWVSRRIRTEQDYLIAGRSLGFTVATFSIFATWFGAETLIGSAGTVAVEGFSLASPEPFGYGICLLLVGLFFAAPLWRRGLTTLADLYSQRFGSGVERLAALLMIPGSVLWAAAQVRAFGHVLSIASDMNVTTATVLAAALTVAYTAIGGLLVDAITDLIQGVVLVAGLLFLLLATVGDAGGWSNTANAVAAGLGSVPASGAESMSLLDSLEAWSIPVFGSLVAAEIVSRVIATRSPGIARNSALAAGAMYIAVGSIPVIIGLAAASHAAQLADAEQLLPFLAREMLPTAAFVIFSAGLISAILSTVDSTLLVASGLLSHNLLVPLLRISDERAKVRLARLSVLGFGAVAYALAITAEGVFELVELASAFGSAGILVTACFGLFSSFGGPLAATAALAGGMVSYVAGSAIGVPAPFLTSVLVAFTLYATAAQLERRSQSILSTRTDG